MSPDALKAAGLLLRETRGRRKMSAIAEKAGLSESKYEALETGETPGVKGRPGRPVKATVNEYTRAAEAVGLDPLRLLDTLGISHTQPETTTMSRDPLAFAKMLKKRRGELGMSQRVLADTRGGLTHASLSKYEQGDYLPSPASVPVVAHTYNLPEAAIHAAVAASREARVDLRMPEKYARLTPRAWQALLAHADLLLSLQEHTDPE